jgi:hypothetical protein
VLVAVSFSDGAIHCIGNRQFGRFYAMVRHADKGRDWRADQKKGRDESRPYVINCLEFLRALALLQLFENVGCLC